MTRRVYHTKTDQVVQILREAIMSGELQPGERLMQDALAEQLNVSATPIREALRQLESEGILSHSPHKGVRVAEVELEDVEEIYRIRAVLEELATRMAVPNIPAEMLQDLRELHERLDELTESGEPESLRRLNYDFHMMIYEAADMPELLRIIRSLWTKFPWDTLHVLPRRAQASLAEHAALMEAIEDRNPVLAGRRMQEHIQAGAETLREYLSQPV
jgi:DNA-binding GntR family transcriptional regulator